MKTSQRNGKLISTVPKVWTTSPGLAQSSSRSSSSVSRRDETGEDSDLTLGTTETRVVRDVLQQSPG